MRLFRSKQSNDNEYDFKLDDDAVEQINSEFPDDEIIDVKPKHRLRRFIIRFSLLCIIIIMINIAVLFFTGKLWFNQPDKNDYPVRGALIDSDMGKIRWDVFSKQNISAAYIRATKGTSFKDEQFDDNWKASHDSELLTGAYHVFSLNTDGKKQAEYFCSVIEKSMNGRLVPAVEVKLTGIYVVVAPDKDKIVSNLRDFCNYIESRYGVKPVIMCTNRSYEKYVQNEFNDYSLCVFETGRGYRLGLLVL